MEQKKAPEKEEVKVSNEVVVVEALPQQLVREGMSEDGKVKYNFITRDEAVTEILRTVRELNKKI